MSLKIENLKENSELRSLSRDQLRGKWSLPIGLCFVTYLIIGAPGSVPFIGSIASLILSGPMLLGLMIFFLKLTRNQEISFSMGFSGFNYFGKAAGIYLLAALFTFLWALLLIIPGIIKALSYSQALYILADNPDTGFLEAINKSKSMMDGAKGKLFLLGLSFIGWAILSVLSCGIGFLWLIPYMQTSFANFYEDLKANYTE